MNWRAVPRKAAAVPFMIIAIALFTVRLPVNLLGWVLNEGIQNLLADREYRHWSWPGWLHLWSGM